MKQSKARGRVLLAIDRLASELPFHGSILGRWKIVQDSTISTMAVGFQGGRLILYFCPEFVERIKMDQLVGVVEHECNHVLLGHVFHDPLPNENSKARMVSEECGANEFLSHPLPCNPILLSDYPSLPANEDTETRYDRLVAILPDEKVVTLDDHTKWPQILSNGQLSSAVVSVIIAQAWEKLTPEQREKVNLPSQVKIAVDEAVKTSGASAIGIGMATVPWRQVLRKYVGRALIRKPIFGRVPRRFPELVGVIPATGRQPSKLKVVVCIDTSGSVSNTILANFSTEIIRIAKTHEVWVIEADRSVHAVYRFRGPITSVSGRGGTCFIPALAEAERLKADLTIYMTDGYGKVPDSAPRFPVIWCLTSHGVHPCNWGKVVRMS